MYFKRLQDGEVYRYRKVQSDGWIGKQGIFKIKGLIYQVPEKVRICIGAMGELGQLEPTGIPLIGLELTENKARLSQNPLDCLD